MIVRQYGFYYVLFQLCILLPHYSAHAFNFKLPNYSNLVTVVHSGVVVVWSDMLSSCNIVQLVPLLLEC
jgi:hypothetical protein